MAFIVRSLDRMLKSAPYWILMRWAWAYCSPLTFLDLIPQSLSMIFSYVSLPVKTVVCMHPIFQPTMCYPAASSIHSLPFTAILYIICFYFWLNPNLQSDIQICMLVLLSACSIFFALDVLLSCCIESMFVERNLKSLVAKETQGWTLLIDPIVDMVVIIFF